MIGHAASFGVTGCERAALETAGSCNGCVFTHLYDIAIAIAIAFAIELPPRCTTCMLDSCTHLAVRRSHGHLHPSTGQTQSGLTCCVT
jgi:hypothetical protein